MADTLPTLSMKDLAPTRDYLQAVALIIGSVQRAYIPRDPHDWHYGLEVGPRGILTQPMTIRGHEVRASIDLVRHKVRLGNTSWSLKHYNPSEIRL